MLKRNVGIQTSECRTVSVFPVKSVVFNPPRFVAASAAVSNVVYRAAIKSGMYNNNKIVVPPRAAVDWDAPELMSGFIRGVFMAESFTRSVCPSVRFGSDTRFTVK
jgi:hypothetical protein